MHNIYNLEKKWLRYKIKSYLPHIGAAITSILLLVYVLKTIDVPEVTNEQKVAIKENKKQVPIQDTSSQVKQILVQNKLSPKDITNDTLILNPSLDFIKNLRTNSITTYEPKTNNNVEVVNQELIHQEQKTEVKIEEKIALFSIVKQKTTDDIAHVIKRFQKSNDPALSLFLAKKYYKLKDYHKAYNYALITNEINKDIDESWILFSKSLVKLNKKEKAIEILRKYIKQSNSLNAKVLLDNIRSGKFK